MFFNRILSTKRFRNPKKKFGNDHFWEIGLETESVKYSYKYIKEKLFTGFDMVEEYRDISVPWHHYFVLKIP